MATGRGWCATPSIWCDSPSSGTIAFAVMGRSTAVGLTAAAALLLICRIIDLPRRFDFAIIAAMTLIAWGTALGLYGDYYFYDNVVHAVAAFFYAPVLYSSWCGSGSLSTRDGRRFPAITSVSSSPPSPWEWPSAPATR
jgi:hypothetical protein